MENRTTRHYRVSSATHKFFSTEDRKNSIIAPGHNWRISFFDFEIGIADDGPLPFYFPTKGDELYQRWAFLCLVDVARILAFDIHLSRREKAVSAHHLLVDPFGAMPQKIDNNPVLERLGDYGFAQDNCLILCAHRNDITPEELVGASVLLERSYAIGISAQYTENIGYFLERPHRDFKLGVKLKLTPEESQERQNRQNIEELFKRLYLS